MLPSSQFEIKKPLLSVKDAADTMGIPYCTVRSLIKQGKIRVIRNGSRDYVISSSIIDLLNEGLKD